MVMNGSVKLAENQKSWMQLGTTVAVLERARNLELAQVGLNMPQTEVLYCLKISEEPMTPMKLSRMMHKQPHTVSALVHRMQRQGLLTTKRDLKRKNWVRVSLTKKGEEALKRWATANMVPDIFSSLSRKETDALSAITKKLHNRGLELLRKMRPDPYSEPLFW
jgi:DNA-binding MarR family transcriptional regulator